MLKRNTLVWPTFAIWAIACLAGAALAGSTIGSVAAGVQALFLIILVAIHGSATIGWRGIGTFVAIVAPVTFLLEASSIATGFPFGFYVHHMAGPSLLGVPAVVVTGYVLLGWIAWNVACALIRVSGSSGPFDRLTMPIVAAFVLAGYDFVVDPINATALHLYSYRHPGGTFGVPLTNFLGWLFTGWVAFQIFSLVEPRRTGTATTGLSLALLPCLVWVVIAAQYPILLAHAPTGLSVVGDRHYVTVDIYTFAVSASLFAMLLPALVGIARIAQVAGAPD